MGLDQFKSSWQQLTHTSSSQQLGTKENMNAIEDKMRDIDRNVKRRTLYGCIMFVLMLGSMSTFGYFSYLIGTPIISLVGLASWIVLIAVSMMRLFMVKKCYNPYENTLTIYEFLRHKLSTVESEIQFYLSLVWTILTPMSIGFILIWLGSKASLLVGVAFMTFFIVCCYVSYQYNKYYVVKNLMPVKNDIIANLKTLEERN